MSGFAKALRVQLARILDWEEAHVGFDAAVANIPVAKRGERPSGFEHSPWQLLEHLRIGQNDLVDFCTNREYEHSLAWPQDYWPKDPAPPDAAAWDRSIAAFRADRDRLKELVADAAIDLLATVPTGTGQQTYLRAVLVAADHNAYHLGQLVAVRRALGIWPA